MKTFTMTIEDLEMMTAEIDRLRARIKGLENALEEQHAGTDAVWNEKAEVLKENERLRAEIERLREEVGK